MKVIIPVAGSGTRLRPHTYSLPKPLLTVANKTILAHILDPVVELNPDEVIFVIGYKGDQIRDFVSKNYSFKATFIKQDKLLGLGYALNLAMDSIIDEPLLIILGDTIVKCDLKEFVNLGDNVIGLREVDDPSRFGIAEISDNIITRLVEKPENPKTNLAVIGLYYFKNSKQLKETLSDHVNKGTTTRGEIQFTDALQQLIVDDVKILPYQVDEWFDCGKKETMLSTNQHLLKQLPQDYEDSRITKPVFIEASAKINDSAIGPNVSISKNSVIDNCKIKNSIIGSNCNIKDSEIYDSLIGDNSNIFGFSGSINAGDSSELLSES